MAQGVYEFGPFQVDAAERTLSRDGTPIALTDKVFELLLLLLEKRGHAVTKAELMSTLWPDAVVEENNLTVNVSILRKALGESASERRYIETLARRGYRFIAEVRGSEATAVAPVERYSTTFVGRERELSRLGELLERAVAGQGGVVLVTGDPGMGKTELCEQFLVRAHERSDALVIAIGSCLEQYATGEAYLPFLGALRALLIGSESESVQRVLRQHAPTWCAQFPMLSSQAGARETDETSRANPSRMLREMGDALIALSSLKPLILVLEDMHWADPSSSDLLRLLAERAQSLRLLIVATLRGNQVEIENHPLKNIRRELLAHDQCEELGLPLLEQKSVAHYLDARFGSHELPNELAELIVRTTEGQPLFVTRLVQLLVERRDIEQKGGSWSLTRAASDLKFGVPESVRGVLRKKLESLSEGDLRALQFASVAGVEFTSAMAASLLSVDEVALEERLDQLARVHRLLVQLGEERLVDGLSLRYRFAHVLYRDVLYESLASKRRMQLHGQVAERLLFEHGDDSHLIASQLALHFEAARNFERAIRHLQEAADNAARLHANREAKQHYARALALVEELPMPDRPPAFIILHYNHGWCNFKVGDLSGSLRDFEAMLEHASTREFAAEGSAAERARSVVFDYFGRPWRDAFGIYDMPRMPNQDRSMGAVAIQCEALWAICLILLQTSRLVEMGHRLEEFLRLAETAGNQPRRVEALAWKAMHELRMAELDQAAQTLNEATPLARALSHQRALSLCCEAGARLHYLRSDYEAAEALNAEALTLSFEAAGRIGCLLGIGLSRVPLGRFSAALAALNEAFEIAKHTELDPSLHVFLCAALGWLFVEAGDPERALTHLNESAELAKAHGLGTAQGRCFINLARAHMALGDTREAETALTQGERLISFENRALEPARGEDRRRNRDQLSLLAAQGEHHMMLGNFELARRRGHALLEPATRRALPEYVAIARHLNARAELGLGNSDVANLELQAGLEALGARTLPLIRWKLLTLLGAERLRAGDAAAAAEAFAAALEIIDQISTSIAETTLRAKWEASAGVQKLREQARQADETGGIAASVAQ